MCSYHLVALSEVKREVLKRQETGSIQFTEKYHLSSVVGIAAALRLTIISPIIPKTFFEFRIKPNRATFQPRDFIST
jgi:hypothetical protein